MRPNAPCTASMTFWPGPFEFSLALRRMPPGMSVAIFEVSRCWIRPAAEGLATAATRPFAPTS